MNSTETITQAFADYYRTTILSEEADPNKLHDLKAVLDGYEVYSQEQIDKLVELYLGGAGRENLDAILDLCVAVYKDRLDENGQVDFKGKGKAFTRTYDFLSSILPYNNAAWEKLSIFLSFLFLSYQRLKRKISQRHPRNNRYGQLSSREKGGHEDNRPRPRCGDRACTGYRRRPETRARAGSAQQYSEGF